MSAEPGVIYSALPHTVRGEPAFISAHPKGETIIYPVAQTVVIRKIDDTTDTDVYLGHAHQVTACKYAPSGFYICSGDAAGNVRIWDTTQKEHILKAEFRPITGCVRDIAWSPDNQRIIVAGEGKESFATVFIWDTGSTVGTIEGHQKQILSCDFKQTRPFRIVTGGEDNFVNFHEGPPFKTTKVNKEHTRFVNAVRFSPDGAVMVSGSSDGKILKYDGKTGEKTGEIGSPAHKGSVMGLSFSADGKQLLSGSADKTAKIWDVESGECKTTFEFGTTVDDMQLAALWTGDNVITVGLNGSVFYLDPSNPGTPKKELNGHNKTITALCSDGTKIWSGSYDGRSCVWNAEGATAQKIAGKGHGSQVSAMARSAGGIVTVGFDDSCRLVGSNDEFIGDGMKLDSQPKDVSSFPELDVAAIACTDRIMVVKVDGSGVVAELKVDWDPECCAIKPGGKVVAAGGRDQKIYLYNIEGSTLTQVKTYATKSGVACMAFSPDGRYLAAGDGARNVYCLNGESLEVEKSGWVFHSAKVATLAWASDSTQLATGGLDRNIFVWNTEKPTKRVQIKNAHAGNVKRVTWLNDGTILSTGEDCCIRSWKITPP
eukprot:Clim_evm1s156 gene=Clim_evmTU1s156